MRASEYAKKRMPSLKQKSKRDCMTAGQAKKNLKETLADYLPLIDATLSAQEIRVSIRPFRAAVIFVEDFVLEVSGDDKTNYPAKPWFAILYHYVDEWYREQYGAAFKADKSGFAIGVVLVREIPVEVQVPLTRLRVETPGESSWVFFPVEVEKDEEPLEWLVSPPTLERLLADEKSKLGARTVTVASSLRSLQMNLMGIEPRDEQVTGLLDGVLAEFETSARNILRNDTSGRGSALWALQMATERILKAFAKHKMNSFREIHNLFELFDDMAEYLSGINRDLLKKLPRDKQAVTDRYGLGGTPSLPEMIDAYNSALELSVGISRLFKRKLSIGGGGLLLKRPPWLTLPAQK